MACLACTACPAFRKCALARRLSVQMRFLYAKEYSRFTPVDATTFRVNTNNALARRLLINMRVLYTRNALARRVSIQINDGGPLWTPVGPILC